METKEGLVKFEEHFHEIENRPRKDKQLENASLL